MLAAAGFIAGHGAVVGAAIMTMRLHVAVGRHLVLAVMGENALRSLQQTGLALSFRVGVFAQEAQLAVLGSFLVARFLFAGAALIKHGGLGLSQQRHSVLGQSDDFFALGVHLSIFHGMIGLQTQRQLISVPGQIRSPTSGSSQPSAIS